MPEMNGRDATIAIRSEFPHARIIILTTYAGDAQVLRVMKVGARGYLVETLPDKELLETIRAVHAGKRMFSAEAPTSWPSIRRAKHGRRERSRFCG
jgi:DNA-binding NarL/FixJ family response regulator